MDFRWLETFVGVADRGGFAAAAADLHLSQPGVSRQIQRLERELGAALFERRGGGVRLTPAGERFRLFAVATLDAYRSLRGELLGEESEITGELRIAASSIPGEFVVPGLVAAFVGLHPAVRPSIAIADSAAVVAEVRAHRCDAGFVGARLGGGLRYRPLAEDEVVLAVPAAHRFAARGEVALAELAGQPFLEREGGSGTAASVDRLLAERGLAVPDHRTVMVLGSTQAIVSAVERGLGLGWVSSLALTGRQPDRVARVRLAELPLRRTLWLVDDPGRPLPSVAAAFVAWLVRQEGPGAG